MTELSSGVRTLVARMQTNPEEFFGDAHKWRFMFADKFRDVMTEPEKGAIHAALKEVRRKEFDTLAVKTLLEEEAAPEVGHTESGSWWGAQVKQVGAHVYTPAMTLDSSGNLGIGAANPQPALQIGKTTLNEKDLIAMKEASISRDKFK